MREFLMHTLGNIIKHYWQTHNWFEITITVIELIFAYFVIAIVSFTIWQLITNKDLNNIKDEEDKQDE